MLPLSPLHCNVQAQGCVDKVHHPPSAHASDLRKIIYMVPFPMYLNIFKAFTFSHSVDFSEVLGLHL